MAPVDSAHRRDVFVVAVAILVIGFLAIRLLGEGEEAGRGEGPRPTVLEVKIPADSEDGTARAAVRASRSFLRAYLRYQVGALGTEDRAAILRWASPRLRRDILSLPPRAMAGSTVARERVLGVSDIAVGLVRGEPALRIGITVSGGGGTRVLTLTLLRRGSGWLVTGVES